MSEMPLENATCWCGHALWADEMCEVQRLRTENARLRSALSDCGATDENTSIWHQLNCVAWEVDDWTAENCGPICANARAALAGQQPQQEATA